MQALRNSQRAIERAPLGSAGFLRVNEEFHALIADASGNRPLVRPRCPRRYSRC